VRAVARAGIGVNNIPVDALSERGVAVFNTPGANANAVKELVIAGALAASRNLCEAWAYTRALEGDDDSLHTQVEAGKKRFAGSELRDRTMGVVGLGFIGRSVANLCAAMDMKVVGYDPMLTVDGAWQLSASIQRASSLEDLLRRSEYITFHVPLTDGTRGMLDSRAVALLRSSVVVLNFARAEVVNEEALLPALDSGRIRRYVTDFPATLLQGREDVLAFPHLGASTTEAEETCARMAVEQVRDFLDNGDARNSVNLPEVSIPRGAPHRLAVINRNEPTMLSQIINVIARDGLNVADMINQSRGEYAYTVLDIDGPIETAVLDAVTRIDGVLSARVL